MGSYYGKKFDKVARNLRKRAPVSVPVAIKTVPTLKGDCGAPLYGHCLATLTSRGKIESFEIAIVRGLPLDTAIDTLLHEWAHAVDQIENGSDCGHGPKWGAAYAKMWRLYTGED